MITVNAAFLSEVNRSIVSRFKRGLGRGGTFWQEVAQRETSSTSQSIYPFIGATGTLREWVGNRVVEDFKSYDFAIKNRDFEKTLRVRKPMLEDDQFGFYGNESEMLGDAANRHPDKLITTLIEGGFVTNGYDGVPFFATNHPTAAGGTASNKGTTALSAASFAAARAQMLALTDDGGEVLDLGRDLLLVVPPALEETARIFLNTDLILVGGVPTTNIWKNSARLLVINRLTDANNWFVFDMGQILRPFIMQFRKDPAITSLTNLTDENVFKRNEFLWGVDYRGEAGYSLWQLAFGAAVA